MLYPKVSCICPTRARYETLREAIAFFILQDYPNKELIIFNNHPIDIVPHPKLIKHNIKVINAGDYSGTSIQKVYADALKHISTDAEYIAIWDDDDFYFPYHLSENMAILLASDKDAVRCEFGYWQDTHNSIGDDYVIISNTLEASMIAKKGTIFFDETHTDKESPAYVHPHTFWVSKCTQEDKFVTNKQITAIFRWHYGKTYHHLQSSGAHNNNVETGNGELLKPKDVNNLFYDFFEKVYLTINEQNKVHTITREQKNTLINRLTAYDLTLFKHIDKYKVFMYWNDNNVPTFINYCYKSIAENTFCKVIFFNDESLKNYQLPSYFWNLTSVEKSDYVRVYFIQKEGGFWFDADTFVIGDLDKYYFQHLCNKETLFPAEYDTEGNITTPLIASKPYSLIFTDALKRLDDFLQPLTPPYNLGWAKLGFTGILASVDTWKHRLGWNFTTISGLVKWGYNNGNIDKWDFEAVDCSKLQIYIFHWSQMGYESSHKIEVGPNETYHKIAEAYPNLKKMYESYTLPYQKN